MNVIIYVGGGLLCFLFIGAVMCLCINSGRIAEQEERRLTVDANDSPCPKQDL